VLKPIEIIRQATIIGARIVRMEGKLGVVRRAPMADLIAIDGNSAEEARALPRPGRRTCR